MTDRNAKAKAVGTDRHIDETDTVPMAETSGLQPDVDLIKRLRNIITRAALLLLQQLPGHRN